MHRPDLAGGHHRPGLLHQRVAAVVEGDGVHDAGGGRGVAQAPGLGGGRRQGLVADHVLAVRERRVDDRAVQRVGRRDVHDVHVGVGGERREAAVGLRHAERSRLRLRRGLGAGGHRHDVDEPEAAHRVDVVRADESRADQAHAEATGHEVSACFAKSTQAVTSATAPRVPGYWYST